jgi:mercuric ion transport protein
MAETSSRRLQRLASPLLTLGGIGASFGLAACCALPFYLAALGVGTAWLGDIGIYAEFHRPVFFVVAVIGLLAGAALLWFQRKTFPRTIFWLTAFGLVVGLVFLFLGTRSD